MLVESSSFNKQATQASQTKSKEQTDISVQIKNTANKADSTVIVDSYRMVEQVPKVGRVLQLGWKVIELSLEQVDLALYCISMLQAQLSVPIKFYTPSDKEYKQLWLEWQLRQQKKTEIAQRSIQGLSKGKMIPKIQSFIKTYMSWQYMSSKDYEDTKVIQLFKREVINPIVTQLRQFKL